MTVTVTMTIKRMTTISARYGCSAVGVGPFSETKTKRVKAKLLGNYSAIHTNYRL